MSGYSNAQTVARLEMLRVALGHDSLLSFWQSLVRKESVFGEGITRRRISYEAARTYHSGRSDVPVAYMARICEVYPHVNISWIVGMEQQLSDWSMFKRRPVEATK